MNILGNFIIALSNIVDFALTLYSFLVIAAAVLSWISPPLYHPAVRFIYRVTEPALKPIRRLLPLRLPIDISPLILLILIYLIQNVLILSLKELGYRIKGGNI